MKNTFKYFIVPFAMIFGFLTTVNAGVCGNVIFEDPDEVYIPIGEVPVNICLEEKEVGPKKANKGPYPSVKEAAGSCRTTYTAKENKHHVTVHIGPCDKEQVKIDWYCSYQVPVYGCPDGTTLKSDGSCQDSKGKTYSKVISGYDTKTTSYTDQHYSTEGANSQIEAKCNTDNGVNNCKCSSEIYLRYEYYDVVCVRSGLGEVEANGNKYYAGDEEAYCINPSYYFPEYGSTWDSTFDVTKCKNARSSKDCGYASILIEGDRIGASYGAIATALRLWGADEQYVYDYKLASGGYDDTGLPVRGSNGAIRNFQPPYINIYKRTVANIDKYLKSGQKIETVQSPSDLKMIACSHDMETGAGVVCGYSGDYLDAIYLYINTIQGNPKMLEHLDEKLTNLGYDTTESKYVVDAKITNYNEETKEIEITEILEKDVEVECDLLEGENKEYCRMPKQIISIDIGGKQVLLDSTQTDMYYNYCKKNRCVITIQPSVAICDKTKTSKYTTIHIEYDYEKTIAQRVVKKFVSCVSSNVDKEQIMFVYDLKDEIYNTPESSHRKHDLTSSPTMDIKYVCKCNEDEYDGPDAVAYGAGNFDKAAYDNTKVETFKSNQDGLNNVCGNVNQDGSYNSKNTFLSGPYDTYTKSSVFEPSISQIVNMCRESKKELYDYSDYYGVNSKVCKLYCRDEVDYILANKTKVYAGMTFKYDIATKMKDYPNLVVNQVRKGTKEYNYYLINGNSISTIQDKKDNPSLLTSIVIEQRDCVSNIFFNTENEDGKTWKQLYDSVVAQGEKDQLVYDLENCNLFSGKNSNVNKDHKIDVDVIVQAVNISDKEGYTTIDYANKMVKTCTDDKNCPTMTLSYTDATGNTNVNMALDTDIYVSGITYCTNNGSDRCYQYHYDSSTNTAQDKLGGSKGYKSTVYSGRTVPANDYASFTINKEYDFYNNEKYYTKVGDGSITTQAGADRLELDDYSYPTSADTVPGSYTLKQKYTIASTLYRKKRTDDFSKLLKKLNNYTCYVDLDNKTKIACTNPPCDEDPNKNKYGLGYSFKNIAPNNIFPSSENDETWKSKYAINWDTSKASEVQTQIQNSAGDYFTTNEYLEYSISLSPNDVKSIRKYNEENNTLSTKSTKGYLNKTLFSCTKTEDGLLLNCKSSFLESIRKSEFGFKFNEIGGNN